MTATTRKLGHDKHKEKRKSPNAKLTGRFSRMKRYLSSMLLGGTIALTGCISTSFSPDDAGTKDAIAKHDSAKDSSGDAKKCYSSPENILTCEIPASSESYITPYIVKQLFVDDMPLEAGKINVYAENGIIGNESRSVDLRITDENCNTLTKETFTRGQTKKFSLTVQNQFQEILQFVITVNEIEYGEVGAGTIRPSKIWANVTVTPDCEKYCAPWLTPYETYSVTLGEGETTTVNGWTLVVDQINQATPKYPLEPKDCTIIDKTVKIRFGWPNSGPIPNGALPENICIYSIGSGSGIGVYIKEISQFVQERDNQCIISNENVTLTLKVSTS